MKSEIKQSALSSRASLHAVKLVNGSECLRVEIKARLTIVTTTLSALLVSDLMLLTILAGFLLIRVREFADRIELFNMLDGGLVAVVDASAPARLIGILSLLLACSSIAGSWCACKT